MSEAEFDIDAAEEAYNRARGQADEDEREQVDEVDVDDPDPKHEPDDDPTHGDGHLSYEEYIEQGGDPARYKGKKAFNEERQRIEENKRLRRELKEIRETMRTTVDAVGEWRTEERKRLRAEIEADLLEARRNEDVDGAIKAKERLDEYDRQTREVPQQRREHPVIEQWREDNPLLDRGSDEFNEEFNADVEALFNSRASAMSDGFKRPLTEGQIKRLLKAATREARQLHDLDDAAPDPDADAGESQRNKRRAGGQGARRRANQREREPRAEDYVIDNPRNPRQRNAATEIADTVRKTAYQNAIKRGLSEKDANAYADKEKQTFVNNLHK